MSLSKFGNWREATNDNIGVAPGLNQKTKVAPVLDAELVTNLIIGVVGAIMDQSEVGGVGSTGAGLIKKAALRR